MRALTDRSMNQCFRFLTGAAVAAAFLAAGAVWAGDDASGSCPHAKAGAKKAAASCPTKAKTEKAAAEKPVAAARAKRDVRDAAAASSGVGSRSCPVAGSMKAFNPA